MSSFFKNFGRNIIVRASQEFQDVKPKAVESVYPTQPASIFSKSATNAKPDKSEVITVAFESIWRLDGEKNDAKDEEVEGSTIMKLLDANGHLLKTSYIMKAFDQIEILNYVKGIMIPPGLYFVKLIHDDMQKRIPLHVI